MSVSTTVWADSSVKTLRAGYRGESGGGGAEWTANEAMRQGEGAEVWGVCGAGVLSKRAIREQRWLVEWVDDRGVDEHRDAPAAHRVDQPNVEAVAGSDEAVLSLEESLVIVPPGGLSSACVGGLLRCAKVAEAVVCKEGPHDLPHASAVEVLARAAPAQRVRPHTLLRLGRHVTQPHRPIEEERRTPTTPRSPVMIGSVGLLDGATLPPRMQIAPLE